MVSQPFSVCNSTILSIAVIVPLVSDLGPVLSFACAGAGLG